MQSNNQNFLEIDVDMDEFNIHFLDVVSRFTDKQQQIIYFFAKPNGLHPLHENLIEGNLDIDFFDYIERKIIFIVLKNILISLGIQVSRKLHYTLYRTSVLLCDMGIPNYYFIYIVLSIYNSPKICSFNLFGLEIRKLPNEEITVRRI